METVLGSLDINGLRVSYTDRNRWVGDEQLAYILNVLYSDRESLVEDLIPQMTLVRVAKKLGVKVQWNKRIPPINSRVIV